jgi:photosystem II stability/assembly factor-like uncharacterized protein
VKRILLVSTLFVAGILFVISQKQNEPIRTVNHADREQEKKQDAPEEFIAFHQGIRTQEGMDAPAYDDNYQLKELAQARKSASRKSFTARTQSGNGVIEWKERGPANVPGRTRGLIADPDDATHKTWIAGSATGGIWRTTNAGTSWHWLTPDFPNLATTVLVMAESNHNIIYAGTGEGFGLLNGVLGHGIFKSTDRGITWVFLSSTSDMEEINRIIVDPSNANKIIAASNTGIYRSTDGGLNWTEVYKGVVQDLRAVPGNFNVQYATRFGVGVIKSQDGGVTWTLSNTGMNPNGRVEIDISPVKTDRIFASAQGTLSGTNSDLYISDDGGATWSLVELLLSNKTLNYLGSQGWYDNTILCDPFNKDVVYVGGIGLYRILLTAGSAGTATGSYTMEEFNTASFITLTNFGAEAYQGKLDLGAAANKTSVEIRFGAGKSQKAHRFTVPVGSTSGVAEADYTYQDYVTVPFEVWDISTNRQLMVSFRDQDRNGKFNLSEANTTGTATEQSREYLFINNIDYNAAAPNASVSVAGGHQFQMMYNIWPTLTPGGTWNPDALPSSALRFLYSEVVKITSIVTSVSDPYNEYDGKNNVNYVHPDHHNIVAIKESEISKTFRLLIANDGGIFLSQISTSPGTTQSEWLSTGNGYNTSQFYGADKRPGADQYLGGMQDNSTYFSPNNVVASASTTYATNVSLFGDGFEAVWHNLEGKKMIGGSQFNNFSRSLDGGLTWQKATTGLTLSGTSPDSEKFPFISKLANSKQAPEILFTIGSEGVWKSADFGGNWALTPITEKWGLTSYADVEVSRANANIIWAGSGMSTTRGLYVSSDGGKTYNITTNYTDALLGSITKLASHPIEEKTAYAVFSFAKSPKILRTKDLGNTWEDISGFGANNTTSTRGFPDVAVYCLYVRPDNPDIIWAGTEIGIVESLDGGNSWGILNDFPNVSVWDLKGQDDQIVIATHGRGIWTAKLETTQSTVINPAIMAMGTSPKSELMIRIKLQENFDSTQVWINGIMSKRIASVAQGEYDIKIEGVPNGIIQARLISFKGTAPVHSAAITGENLTLKSYQNQYFNYFINSNDFSLNGFSVQTFGSSNTSLKSQSNYLVNTESVATLLQPIILTADYPFLFYRDIAIVEPGSTGSVFGESAFKDYVVVEATHDGLTWTPISNGYDASFNSNWLSTYFSSLSGNPNQFIDHNIDLISKFSVGDTLLFRMRLYSDNNITGWGWVVDDLYIQQKPTGVAETFISSMSLQAYPNPSNGTFNISFTISKSSPVELTVHDLAGRIISKQAWENKEAGKHAENIILHNARGVYLLKLKTNNGQQVQKIIVGD